MCIRDSVYNAHPYLGFPEEVITEEERKNIIIWRHSKNDNSIIYSENYVTRCTGHEMISYSDGLFLAVSFCKIMDTVRYPLHPAPWLLEEHYGLENWGQSARN